MMTADSWPDSTSSGKRSVSPSSRRAETDGWSLVPAAASGTPATPAGMMVEVLREAIARSTPEEALRTVIEMAVDSGPCDAASITTVAKDRTMTTIAGSDQRVLQADGLQYELNEGPCLDAVWTNGVFAVSDLLEDGRWPRWAPKAAELGVGASMSLHLFTDTRLGSLNLYSLHPRSFDAADVETARVIAAHASVVLAYANTTQNLWRAIDARNLIGQAQGMLMARYGLTAPKAFAVLRRYSQQYNIKLTVLAEQLTTTGQLPGLNQQQLVDPG